MTTEVLTPEKILFFGHPMWEKRHTRTHTSLMSQKVSSFLKKYLREWTMFQSRDKKVTSPPSGNLPSTISETDKLKKLQWSDCKSYCLNLYKNKSAIVIILLLSSGTVQNIIKKKRLQTETRSRRVKRGDQSATTQQDLVGRGKLGAALRFGATDHEARLHHAITPLPRIHIYI